VAFVTPWGGFQPADLEPPALIVHGGDDRVVPVAHADHLFAELSDAERWIDDRAGHIAVLAAVPAAMTWLLDRIVRPGPVTPGDDEGAPFPEPLLAP